MGCNLSLKRNNNNDAIIRTAAADEAKIVIRDIGWYIPHFTPSLENQQIIMDQLLNKDPTELFYTERTVFRKDVNTNNNWSFELGMATGASQSSGLPPTYVIVGFQNRNKIESQTHDKATFDSLPISSAVCTIGSENYTDNMITCDYDRDNYHEAYVIVVKHF